MSGAAGSDLPPRDRGRHAGRIPHAGRPRYKPAVIVSPGHDSVLARTPDLGELQAPWRLSVSKVGSCRRTHRSPLARVPDASFVDRGSDTPVKGPAWAQR